MSETYSDWAWVSMSRDPSPIAWLLIDHRVKKVLENDLLHLTCFSLRAFLLCHGNSSWWFLLYPGLVRSFAQPKDWVISFNVHWGIKDLPCWNRLSNLRCYLLAWVALSSLCRQGLTHLCSSMSLFHWCCLNFDISSCLVLLLLTIGEEDLSWGTWAVDSLLVLTVAYLDTLKVYAAFITVWQYRWRESRCLDLLSAPHDWWH